MDIRFDLAKKVGIQITEETESSELLYWYAKHVKEENQKRVQSV